MAESSIEWTDVTWNPVTGCKKISPGCKFCYAEVMARRLKSMRVPKYKDGFAIRTHYDSLNVPFSWKKPRIVFVNSMSDLFHDEIPLEFIKAVFAVMNSTPQHTYQVLTKRSDRLIDVSPELKWSPNIWMGVSVENRNYIHRIDELRQTGASVKFLSIEPLLADVGTLNLTDINWVIVGGESGHGARPIKYDWIKSIKNQCDQGNIPFFFKQWGKPKFNVDPSDPTIHKDHPHHAKGGCLLDGNKYRSTPISNQRILAA